MNDRPHYPWKEGDALFADELNAAIAGASDTVGGELNVLIFGADPTGASDSLAAFNAAAASVAAGTDLRIRVPRGIYKMSAAFNGNGRNVTLDIDPGTTWTGFNPPWFGPRAEHTQAFQRVTDMVLFDTDKAINSVSDQRINEAGAQGPTAWAMQWVYTGTPLAGQPWQSVPRVSITRWDDLSAASYAATLAQQELVLFPKAATGSGAIAEWNPVNRSGDPGWSNVFGAQNSYYGINISPNSDTTTGGPHYGYHVQAAFSVLPTTVVNNLGYLPRTYTAFIAYRDAIAPGGCTLYCGGDTSGTTAQFPHAPVRVEGNHLHGIDHTQAVYADKNAMAMLAGQGVAWLTGTTGTPTNICRDTAGSGSPEGVVTANKGSTYRRFDGGAASCFYVKESGTGNTGWVAK